MAALMAYYSIDRAPALQPQKAAGKPAAADKTRPPSPAPKPKHATTTQSPPPQTAAAVDDDATTTRRGFPPTFVYHAEDDATVPFENSVRLAGALKAAGVRLDRYSHSGRCCIHVNRLNILHSQNGWMSALILKKSL